jgi:hypothetical protein
MTNGTTSVLFSNNYGKSWTSTLVNAAATTTTCVDISASGKYVAVAGTNYIYFSINYGQTWTTSGLGSTANVYRDIAISADGQYLGVISSANGYYLTTTPYAQNLFATLGRTTATTNPLVYNIANNEVRYSTNVSKTFIVDHPLSSSSYLVHACLEGPETGVYYRGTGKIENDAFAVIMLPSYVSTIAVDFTVQLSSLVANQFYTTSEVENGVFTVYGKNGSFHWCVYGNRKHIDVEPAKADVVLRGTGPYTYLL